MTTEERSMGLFDHIVELRQRLFYAVGALLVATIVASAFVDTIVGWLVSPLQGGSVIVLSPTEAPIVYFKVALAAGFGVSLPILLYQLYSFAAPGLYRSERSVVITFMPAALVFFVLGAVFTLQVLMPISLPVLMGFLGEVVEPTYSLESYLSFVTTLVLWMGLIFETPLVVYVVARLGLLTPTQLSKGRRVVWFVAVIFAAIITPTTDPVTLLLVTGPFIMLYEIGLILARLGMRQRSRAVKDEE
jgi:sec-independent protein translocase protein TatC